MKTEFNNRNKCVRLIGQSQAIKGTEMSDDKEHKEKYFSYFEKGVFRLKKMSSARFLHLVKTKML